MTDDLRQTQMTKFNSVCDNLVGSSSTKEYINVEIPFIQSKKIIKESQT
ncbi:MAG: hypothetical protein ACW99F_03910 [Candidatus Hodarchaeales archaeon]|jgi:hypothetical protein